jgi:hypothetical protein
MLPSSKTSPSNAADTEGATVTADTLSLLPMTTISSCSAAVAGSATQRAYGTQTGRVVLPVVVKFDRDLRTPPDESNRGRQASATPRQPATLPARFGRWAGPQHSPGPGGARVAVQGGGVRARGGDVKRLLTRAGRRPHRAAATHGEPAPLYLPAQWPCCQP